MPKSPIALRFAQAQHSYDSHAIVQQQVAVELLGLIKQYVPRGDIRRALEIGCGSGMFTRLFMAVFDIDRICLNDLYPEVKTHFSSDPRIQWYIGDIERVAIPQELDLVASSSVLQWIADPARLFTQVHEALVASRFFCFSSYGQDNFKEIKALTGQGLAYLRLDQICDLLEQQQFEILHKAETRVQLYFDHPKDVLRHIRYTGVHATGHGFRWTRTSLEQFYEDYRQYQCPETQRFPLTYHPIYIITRKRHDRRSAP